MARMKTDHPPKHSPAHAPEHPHDPGHPAHAAARHQEPAGPTPPHPHDLHTNKDVGSPHPPPHDTAPSISHAAAMDHPDHHGVIAVSTPTKQKPSLGRIVLVGVKDARGDFFVRPAVMVQIGPVRVDDEDQDQVGLHVFHTPHDGPSKDNYVVGHLRDPLKPWEPGDWEWPSRA